MSVKQLLPGIYAIGLGGVNAFLIDAKELTLIDTGYEHSQNAIIKAVRQIGRQPEEIRNIVLTHHHPDHAGGLANMKALTGARIYAHPIEAEILEAGGADTNMEATPGLFSELFLKWFVGPDPIKLKPVTVDETVTDGEVLDIAGGLQAIHTPGHCAGQLAFIWNTHGKVLFTADLAANYFRLGMFMVYESIENGLQDLKKVSGYSFEKAFFSHGRPIMEGADRKFREKWG